MQKQQLVGIIGGVGPEATNYFTSLLVKLRGRVNRDQDHIPYLLYNNPQIPDRTKYILYGGEDPVPEIVHTANQLKKAGATFLVIPCNTAHAFTETIQEYSGLPILNMVELTAQYIITTYGPTTTVGLLATTGTIASKLYQNALTKISPAVQIVVPQKKTQTDVMKAIYEIKKFSVDEYNANLLISAAQELVAKGASIIILGCTEIPLAITQEVGAFQRVDPMEILATHVLNKTLQNKIQLRTNVPRDIKSPRL